MRKNKWETRDGYVVICFNNSDEYTSQCFNTPTCVAAFSDEGFQQGRHHLSILQMAFCWMTTSIRESNNLFAAPNSEQTYHIQCYMWSLSECYFLCIVFIINRVFAHCTVRRLRRKSRFHQEKPQTGGHICYPAHAPFARSLVLKRNDRILGKKPIHIIFRSRLSSKWQIRAIGELYPILFVL